MMKKEEWIKLAKADRYNPGSKRAIENGCVCEIQKGIRFDGLNGGVSFFVNGDCPQHGYLLTEQEQQP